jgi:hypothetical protein
MIFRKLLQSAQRRTTAIKDHIAALKSDIERLDAAVAERKAYWETISSILLSAGQDDNLTDLCTFYAPNGGVFCFRPLNKRDRDYGRYLREWEDYFAQAEQTRALLLRKIAELETRLYEIEFWILHKKEIWTNVSAVDLKAQLRSIYQAGEELSKFVLGRKVDIRFIHKEHAPLACVPLAGSVGRRRIFLSSRILAEQPGEWEELYRALIVHELGHLALHIRPSHADFQKVKRALANMVNIDQRYQEIFNIILDEHLERNLRDTRPEWQTWFRRLEFYARRIDVFDLKNHLIAAGLESGSVADVDLKPYAEQNLLKVYHDPKTGEARFASILSAAFLSEEYGFSRQFAFYYALRFGLDRQGVIDDWLRECLDLIPRNFRKLSILELHALALRIFHLIHPRFMGLSVRIPVILKNGQKDELHLPGTFLDEQEVAAIDLRGEAKRKKQRGNVSGGRPPLALTSREMSQAPLDPEGAPPPPAMRETKQLHRQPGQSKYKPGSGGEPVQAECSGPGWRNMTSRGFGGEAGGGYEPVTKRNSPPKSLKDLLRQKIKSGRVSAREKTRLQKMAQAENSQRQETNRSTNTIPRHSGPKHGAQPQTEKNWREKHDLNEMNRRAEAPPSAWSPGQALRDFSAQLNDQLKQIRQAPEQPKSLASLPEHKGQAPDFRDTSPTTSFPKPEQVFRLVPDLARERLAAARVGPLVPALRSWLHRIDESRLVDERLPQGRFIPSEMLKKLICTGEQRIFSTPRLLETDNYQRLFVAVLVDTSSSMHNEDRLTRAKAYATLLAQCLADCPDMASLFLAFNQNIYLCGDHHQTSVNSLSASGKTNEAGALDFLRRRLEAHPARRGLVIVLGDGQPTAGSVAAVAKIITDMRRTLHCQFLLANLTTPAHPAYPYQITLPGAVSMAAVNRLGRAMHEVMARLA